MLYQEGWGVGKIKHSLTYSGGLSRSYSGPTRRRTISAFVASVLSRSQR